MLERYFVKPQTVDRIQASWIGSEIEQYVDWLAEREYSTASVQARVPVLIAFGEFAWAGGARTVAELPDHVDGFMGEWMAGRPAVRQGGRRIAMRTRGPIEQMLTVVIPGFVAESRVRYSYPFVEAVPGFFEYLVSERGLRPVTIDGYRHHLGRLELFLDRIGVAKLSELSPSILSAFVADRASEGLQVTSLRDLSGALRVFLRYAYREGAIGRDLSVAVEWPLAYRLSSIPRSITWEEVGLVLAGVDRRSPCGKRDWAILMLLVTYGLRGREVAGLTLDDIDWRRERLRVPERKAGHSTAYPLSTSVGEALVDYLQHGRPRTDERQLFFCAVAPFRPITHGAVASRAAHYLRKAKIDVPRPGSHTLRHTCVQRLVDADFSLKTIGDFVGHRSPKSTEVYAKVAVEQLREVALGDGEEILG
jgi:site-specific recombinase XerD